MVLNMEILYQTQKFAYINYWSLDNSSKIIIHFHKYLCILSQNKLILLLIIYEFLITL